MELYSIKQKMHGLVH